MSLTPHKTNPEHERLRNIVMDAIRKEMADMPAQEVLAIFAQVVGQIMAMQDQRTMTPARALEIVGA